MWKAIPSQENQLKNVRIKKWTALFLCIVWTLLMNCVIDVLIKLSVQWWQERRSGEMRKKRQIQLLQAHHNCQKNTRRDSACSETLFCAWVGWQLIALECSLGTQEPKKNLNLHIFQSLDVAYTNQQSYQRHTYLWSRLTDDRKCHHMMFMMESYFIISSSKISSSTITNHFWVMLTALLLIVRCVI